MSDDLFESDDSAVEEVAQAAPAPVAQGTDWEAEAKRAFAERDKAKSEMRRMAIQTEYGTDIAELIPASLPPSEWKDYAAKLAALRGEAVKPNPPAEAKEEPAPSDEAPDPAAERLAAVAGQAPGSAGQAVVTMTAKQIAELGRTDPVAAQRAIEAQYANGAPAPVQPFRDR